MQGCAEAIPPVNRQLTKKLIQRLATLVGLHGSAPLHSALRPNLAAGSVHVSGSAAKHPMRPVPSGRLPT